MGSPGRTRRGVARRKGESDVGQASQEPSRAVTESAGGTTGEETGPGREMPEEGEESERQGGTTPDGVAT